MEIALPFEMLPEIIEAEKAPLAIMEGEAITAAYFVKIRHSGKVQ